MHHQFNRTIKTCVLVMLATHTKKSAMICTVALLFPKHLGLVPALPFTDVFATFVPVITTTLKGISWR